MTMTLEQAFKAHQAELAAEAEGRADVPHWPSRAEYEEACAVLDAHGDRATDAELAAHERDLYAHERD